MRTRFNHYEARNAWGQIEARLRRLGAPDTIFDADFDEQLHAAIERFERKQDQREAEGLERRPLPEDPRMLVAGDLPWFAQYVGNLSRDWVDQVRKDRVTKEKAKAKREAERHQGVGDEK